MTPKKNRIATIDMSGCINSEMQHEIDAIETERKWREYCRKKREKEQ